MAHLATDQPAYLSQPHAQPRADPDQPQAAPGWWIIPMALAGTAFWARLIMWML